MEPETHPLSIGIIMDGNRRWAKQHGQSGLKGHYAGYKKLREVVEWAKDAGVGTVIVYAFSTENWNRTVEEIGYLMKLFHLALNEVTDEMAEKGVHLRVIGERARLPANIAKALERAVEKTKDCHAITVVGAFSYGGRAELIDAIRRIPADKLAGMDEKQFSELLWTKDVPDPDLIIRTGGEVRLSNFLTWQSVYSELFFTDTLWPDFTKEEFSSILEEYNNRDRRHGK
jgi:undecaprenyl diphosphate synthase